MTGRRIVYALTLAGACAFWIYYDGRVSVYVLAVVLFLPLFSLLLSLPFLGKPYVTASMPARTQRNRERHIAFRVMKGSSPSLLPGMIRVTLRDLMEGRDTKLLFRTPEEAAVSFLPAHSGVWQAEIRQAYVCDFLGLWRFRTAYTSPYRITVPPIPEEPVPSPDFSSFHTSAYRPKPGGGFSEIHELREYRPGDPMRSIHWKATAKTDKPVVREAQEAVSRRVLITYALSPGREETDRILDRLSWVSLRLLEQGIGHAVFSESDGDLCAIEGSEDLDAFLDRLMSSRLPVLLPKETSSAPPSDWLFRVDGAETDPVSSGEEKRKRGAS
jgi:uncharacterized protein (DUF58 family)